MKFEVTKEQLVRKVGSPFSGGDRRPHTELGKADDQRMLEYLEELGKENDHGRASEKR